MLYTMTVFGAAWAGAEEKEAGIIALPFTWLLCNTGWIFLHFAGFGDLQSRFSISDGVANWCTKVSLAFFVSVQVWFYGVGNEFVSIMVLWQGIEMVHNKLG